MGPVLKDFHILFVLPPKRYVDDQFKIISRVLANEGAHQKIASLTSEPLEGIEGFSLLPDILLSQVDLSEFQALVLIGGRGVRKLADNQDLQDLIREAESSENIEIISSIGEAVLILDQAGLLEGKSVSVSAEIREKLESDLKVSDSKVEQDGKLLTAKKSIPPLLVGERIKDLLKNKKIEN